LSEEATLVVVAAFTVRPNVPLLVACVVSPLYDPVIVCVPVPRAVGVYVTEHDPPLSVQDMELKLPAPLLLKLTVVVGVDVVPASVSLTVTVQVLALLRLSGFGAQATPVEVERLVTVSLNVPELAAKVELPRYDPVIVWVPVPTAVGV
jgi:hypothetical protein